MSVASRNPVLVAETADCIGIARTAVAQVRSALDLIDLLDRPADKTADRDSRTWTCRIDDRRQLTVSWSAAPSFVSDYTRIVSYDAHGMICEIRTYGGFPQNWKIEDWLQRIMDEAWTMLNHPEATNAVPSITDAAAAAAMGRNGAASANVELGTPWSPASIEFAATTQQSGPSPADENMADLMLLPKGMAFRTKKERRGNQDRLDCSFDKVERKVERPGAVETLRLLALLDETRRNFR